jgi:hypothetical protein
MAVRYSARTGKFLAAGESSVKAKLRASGPNYLSGGRKPPERSGTQGAYAPRSGFCPLALILPAIGTLPRHGWLLLLVVCAGCSSSTQGTISGKVTYQGKPVPAGTVVFVPQVQGGSFVAHIRDGQYKVENCPVGPVKIAVSTPANSAPMKGMISKMKPPAEIQEKLGHGTSSEGAASNDAPTVSIPARFQDPEKSGLSYTVKGGSQVHDIDLADK